MEKAGIIFSALNIWTHMICCRIWEVAKHVPQLQTNKPCQTQCRLPCGFTLSRFFLFNFFKESFVHSRAIQQPTCRIRRLNRLHEECMCSWIKSWPIERLRPFKVRGWKNFRSFQNFGYMFRGSMVVFIEYDDWLLRGKGGVFWIFVGVGFYVGTSGPPWDFGILCIRSTTRNSFWLLVSIMVSPTKEGDSIIWIFLCFYCKSKTIKRN